MHIHELNPWRTLIVLTVFVAIMIVGFVTMREPLLTYEMDMKTSVAETKSDDSCFYLWQLVGFIEKENADVVLFDIRDNFVFGQGHIPGAENLSAQNLAREESIARLEELKNKNTTVVLYGDDQLQANGPVMLFRQVGFDNVKALVGGYQYYKQHKDDLLATQNDSTLMQEIARYNYAEMAAPTNGAAINKVSQKKTVEVTRRKKTAAVAGGC
ncbi:rhodanese-like domain-containing protein [Mangrovibacterium lignilyticum]|uniref:rhodanese-like domain-containing protein n=1 Tax=Mangrovibacterium lignilyticum TaxID=2668052 RepID=UPI0013D21AB2|nr:rhodanese-like domain-containing protein [Mangrovibacterium lignilyticum]